MNSEFNNLFSSLEELISHASKANTEIISETTKYLSGMDRSNLNADTLTNLQQGVLTTAVTKVAALNMKYTKDLLNLGVELSKSLNNQTPPDDSTTPPPSSVSAFEIKTEAVAGGVATTAFLLNSDKDTPIICKVQNTSYSLQAEVPTIVNFETTYQPQLFELIKGTPQRVDVSVAIPKDTIPGVYYSKITVAGFEHTHFDFYITVSAAPETVEPKAKKTTSTAKKTTSATKKTSTTAKKTSSTSTKKTTTAKKK